MVYYDIHTHRQALRVEDIAVVSLDARDRGKVAAMFSADENPSEYYTVGVHPWYADKQLMDVVYEYAALRSVVAIGETGLDKTTAKTPDVFMLQQALFTEHARLSEELKKPLVVHCVKALDELLHIRKVLKPSMPWIIHGFRGNELLATQLLNAGFYLSFGKLYNAKALKTAWEKRCLLAETDDSGADIRDIYKQLAEELNISEIELSAEIEDFFNTKLLTLS